MSNLEDAFSGLKSEQAGKPGGKKFEGGTSLHETVETPWLEKRPVKDEIDALKSLSKSLNIILGNPS